jgi:hypothetical protein
MGPTNYKNSGPPYPAPKGKIWKTDGNCEFVLVDHPDSWIDGQKVKVKNRVTNFTPKKKKRKK